MMDTEGLRQTVLRTVEAGSLARAVRGVEVEFARDEGDDEFLRIKLSVDLPNGNVDDQLEALLEQIEDAISRVDDRYPSVRFLDAA